MGIDGLNNFGSLTTKTGKVLKFEDFDKNGDGKISKDEYTELLKEVELDSVSFSRVDTNKNGAISEEEFAVMEQKIEMQKAVNDMLGQISADFSGDNSKYVSDVLNQLKDFIDDFAKNYGRGYDVNEMADKFKEKLPEKYEEIKNNIKSKMPKEIKSRVVEDLYNEMINSQDSLSAKAKKEFGKVLENLADGFIATYQGENLEADLTAYLREAMSQSDSQRISARADEYLNLTNKYGNYIDSKEFEELKEETKSFLKDALAKGVTIELGDVKITSEKNIEKAIAQFEDGESLIAAMKDAIANLSTLSKLEQISADNQTEKENNVPKNTGSDYRVNGQYRDSSKDMFLASVLGYNVTKDSLRWGLNGIASEMLQQIYDMLKAKGLPLENSLSTIFNNVFSDSIDQFYEQYTEPRAWGGRVLKQITSTNQFGYVSSRSMTPDEIIDAFTEIFNNNIEKAINEKNASDKDMDLQDIDMTFLDKSGTTRVWGGYSWNNYKMFFVTERLTPQLRAKAEAMCTANGIEFNEADFNSILDRAGRAAFEFSVNNESWCWKNIDLKVFGNNLLTEFKVAFTSYVESKTGTQIGTGDNQSQLSKLDPRNVDADALFENDNSWFSLYSNNRGNIDELKDAYMNGGTYTFDGWNDGAFKNMIKNLNNQLKQKAESLCRINNVDSNWWFINTLINQTYNTVIQSGIYNNSGYSITINPQQVVQAYTEDFNTRLNDYIQSGGSRWW